MFLHVGCFFILILRGLSGYVRVHLGEGWEAPYFGNVTRVRAVAQGSKSDVTSWHFSITLCH